MTQNGPRRVEQALTSLFRAISLLNPRRILRHFRSVTYRLNQIARIVNSEAATRVEHGLQAASECERLLREMGERTRAIASQIDRLAMEQRSRADELSAGITSCNAVITSCNEAIKSLRLDRWKVREYEGLLRSLRRQYYFRAIDEGRVAVPVLETEHPVAVSSNDTRFPRGTKDDNSIVPRFNRKLYQLYRDQDPIRVLDIGCAGGGFVRSLLDDGHLAVGLEGSDYQLVNQGAEWSTIPLHLFTCDVTKPFRLTDRATGQPLLFHAITA